MSDALFELTSATGSILTKCTDTEANHLRAPPPRNTRDGELRLRLEAAWSILVLLMLVSCSRQIPDAILPYFDPICVQQLLERRCDQIWRSMEKSCDIDEAQHFSRFPLL